MSTRDSMELATLPYVREQCGQALRAMIVTGDRAGELDSIGSIAERLASPSRPCARAVSTWCARTGRDGPQPRLPSRHADRPGPRRADGAPAHASARHPSHRRAPTRARSLGTEDGGPGDDRVRGHRRHGRVRLPGPRPAPRDPGLAANRRLVRTVGLLRDQTRLYGLQQITGSHEFLNLRRPSTTRLRPHRGRARRPGGGPHAAPPGAHAWPVGRPQRTSGSMSEAEVGLDPRLPLRYLSPADVAARIELASAVDAVRDAFVAAAGDADDQPQRLSLGGGRLLVMATRDRVDHDSVVKVLRVATDRGEAPALGPTIDGILLWLGAPGSPSWRSTPAQSPPSAPQRWSPWRPTCSRPPPRTGWRSSARANRHSDEGPAVALVRPSTNIVVWNRTRRHAETLATQLAADMSEARPRCRSGR